MSAIRDKLFSNFRPRLKDVPIALPNGETVTVRVRTMTGKRYFEMQAAARTVKDAKVARGEAPAPGDEDKIDRDSIMFGSLVACCFDPDTGEQVFRAEDVVPLAEDVSWMKCLKDLVKAMDEVNGETPDPKAPSPGTPNTEAG